MSTQTVCDGCRKVIDITKTTHLRCELTDFGPGTGAIESSPVARGNYTLHFHDDACIALYKVPA